MKIFKNWEIKFGILACVIFSLFAINEFCIKGGIAPIGSYYYINNNQIELTIESPSEFSVSLALRLIKNVLYDLTWEFKHTGDVNWHATRLTEFVQTYHQTPMSYATSPLFRYVISDRKNIYKFTMVIDLNTISYHLKKSNCLEV